MSTSCSSRRSLRTSSLLCSASRGLGLGALLSCALIVAVPSAASAETKHPFRLAAAPTSEALISLAMQANISIANTALCHGRSPAIAESLSLRSALQTVLRASDCSFEFIEPGMVRVFLRPREAAPAAPPPRAAPVVTELVVTGGRHEWNAERLAGGVSTVAGDRASALGAVDASDLNSVLSGVASTNLGPGRNKLLLRGLSDGAFTGQTRSAVGIYLDDVPLTYNAPDPDLRLNDVERIEVARGPQGAFYGAGSLGGVFKIVTNKPQLDRFSAQIGALWATTRTGGSSHSTEAMLNLPIVTDRLALRWVGYDEAQGGYIRGQAVRGSAIDRTVRRGGRLAARLQLDDHWRLDVSAATQRLATSDTHYVTPGMGRRRRTSRVQEAHQNALDEAAVTLDGDGPWGRFSTTLGLVDHRYLSTYDASAATTLPQPRAGGAAIYLEQARTHLIVSDTSFRSPDTGRLRWLAGLYLSQTLGQSPASLEIRQRQRSETVFQERRRDRIWDAALYGEVTYEITPVWTLTAGGRAFHSRAIHESTAMVRTRIIPRTQKLSFEGLSPMLSIQRAIAPRGFLYALYSEGSRPGGMNSPGLGRTSNAPRTFTSDRLENYELGVRLYPLDGRSRVRAAVFYERWNNLQADQYTAAGGGFTTNVGDATNLGLGLEGEYAVREGLSVVGQLQLTSAKLVHANPTFVHKPTGGLPGVPQVSAGGMIEYRKPLTGSLSLVLSAEAAYVGRSHLTLEADSPLMGDYLSNRLAAELTSRHWSASLFIENAGDSAGDTFAFGNPFSLGQVPQTTPQRPRTIGVRLSASL